MPGSGTSTFIDPDDYQANLSPTPLDIRLINGGREFKARVTSVRLHEVDLLRSEEDFPRIAYISLAPALVFVGFVARSSRPIVWGGVELQPQELVLHNPGERFHQRTAGPCSWGLIGLAPAQLARYGEIVTGRALAAPLAARILRPAARNSAWLLRLFAQALPARRDQAQGPVTSRGGAGLGAGHHSRTGDVSANYSEGARPAGQAASSGDHAQV
jgi:hypothetical protein